MQGDCAAKQPPLPASVSGSTAVTPPQNACQILVSKRLIYTEDTTQLPTDMWLHGLRIIFEGTPAGIFTIIQWHPGSASRLWLTDVVTQRGDSGLRLDQGNVFAGGAASNRLGLAIWSLCSVKMPFRLCAVHLDHGSALRSKLPA